jgi:tetrahydromethanopterin S-methyltransferase subunit D
MVGLIMAGSAVLVTGCAERRVVYVPVYPAPPAYAYSTAPGYPTTPVTAQPGVTT